MTQAPLTRNPFRVNARVAAWGNADGTVSDVVRLTGGNRTFAVDFTELPALIAQLEALYADHLERSRFTDELVCP